MEWASAFSRVGTGTELFRQFGRKGKTLETAAYGELTGLVHQRFQGKRAPLEVSIEVTRRCPLDCLHCYNNLPMSDHAARAQELSLEEHRRLLDELVDAGCLWLLYTGGEIFARKDFLEIYTEAKKRGFLITLFTNGTMINERIADHLAEYRPSLSKLPCMEQLARPTKL